MKKTTGFLYSASAMCMLAGCLMTSCSSDDNIDLSKVDMTLEVGADGFNIPGGSTKDVPLVDLLKIDGSDCIDTLENGDYYFHKEKEAYDATKNPEGIKETTVKVDEVAIDAGSGITPYDFIINGSELIPTGSSRGLGVMHKEQRNVKNKIQTFNFSKTDVTEDIKDLLTITSNTKIALTVKFPSDLSSILSTFDCLEFDLPDFLTLGEVKANGNPVTPDANNKISCNNIPTNKDFVLTAYITGLDFKKSTVSTNPDHLIFTPAPSVKDGIVDMGGEVQMEAFLSTEKVTLPTNPADLAALATKTFTLSSVFVFGEGSSHELKFTSATGEFSPVIDLTIDPVKVNDIPEFLTKDGVNINIHDLLLTLNVESTLPLTGMVDATLTPYYKDEKSVTGLKKGTAIAIPNIRIDKEKTSKVLISRRANSDPSYTDKHDPTQAGTGDIGTLMTNIPSEIEFTCTASTLAGEQATVILGKEYVIKPSYKINAPLALDNPSSIVYEDTVKDWNKDLADADFDLYNNSYVMVEAEMTNNTPLTLDIDNPKALDVNGKQLSDVKVQLVDANGNNISKLSVSPSSGLKTALYFKVSSNNNGIKKLDGLFYHVTAKKTNSDGVPLNTGNPNKKRTGKSHTLKIENINMKLNGKVVLSL